MNEFQSNIWQRFNRVYIGQISAVKERSGLIDVVILDGLSAKRESLEIPFAGFSVAGSKDDDGNLLNGFRSSWIRYMPQVDDLVYVAFGPRGEARILGPANMPGGYKALADSRDKFKSKFPYADFTDLKQGEWDMRSSGGAYIFGNRDGALYLAAGSTVTQRLDKQNNETRAQAGLWVQGSVGSYVRLGDIKRRLPTEFKETSKIELDPTAPKEFSVHLETNLPVPLLIADEQLGGVRDDFGAPRLSTLAQPLRYRRKIWALGSTALVSIPVHSDEVDILGNQTIDYGVTSTNVDVSGGPVTNFSLSGLTVSATGTVSASMSSSGVASVSGDALAQLTSTALAQVDALVVQLGTPLALGNPAVHGTTLLIQLGIIVAALVALSATMVIQEGPTTTKGIAWATFGSALAPVVALLAQPPGPPSALLSAKVFVE